VPGTNHVWRECNDAALLWLQYMVHVLFFNLSLRSTCAVSRTAVFCNVYVIVVVIIIIIIIIVVIIIIIIALIFLVVSSPISYFNFVKVCCSFLV
jgi:hypothetical protein